MKFGLSLVCWSPNPFGQDITTVVMGAAPVVDSKVLQQSDLRQTLGTKDTHEIPVSWKRTTTICVSLSWWLIYDKWILHTMKLIDSFNYDQESVQMGLRIKFSRWVSCDTSACEPFHNHLHCWLEEYIWNDFSCYFLIRDIESQRIRRRMAFHCNLFQTPFAFFLYKIFSSCDFSQQVIFTSYLQHKKHDLWLIKIEDGGLSQTVR